MTVEADDLGAVFDFRLPDAPYPGLRPFFKEEWPIFSGREKLTGEVIARTIDQHFIVVHGDAPDAAELDRSCRRSSSLEQEQGRGGYLAHMFDRAGLFAAENLASALATLTGRGR